MEITTSPLVKSFLAGAVSGTCSTVMFQPLDLVKTRIQTSIINGGNSCRMFNVVATVVQKDKFVGLWKGLTPSFSRTVPGIAVYFSSLHYLRNTFGSDKPGSAELVLTGAAARSMSAVLVIPFTVLKTRYESGAFCYESGLRGALFATYKAEGLGALVSGLTPTLLRDVPFSGLYLMNYTKLKQLANERFTNKTSSQMAVIHFACGIQAGMVASLLTQPADVVKTHMQLYPKLHTCIKETAEYIYKRDGIQGFMRGIYPRTIRRTLMAAMAWTIYDEVAKKYGLK